ncbi:MAG TPA: calcium/proton exchanger [Solirubrobacteraceae bacterium]|jgi:Ca2+:H+ antiporter|nr:calcium/proton exchanger [Solirubrobacteraceae bacterium]
MRPVYGLGAFIPAAFGLKLAGASPALVFVTSALGIVPAAALMGDATEQLAARTGAGIGGLVNVTFGNAPELIIAVFALSDGLQEVVKASLVGSIIGNALLVLGASMLAGGWHRTKQTFDRTAAQTQTGMLLLTIAALVLPSVLALAHHVTLPTVGEVRHGFGRDVEHVSLVVAFVLIATYAAGLFFSLRTHRGLFNPSDTEDNRTDAWSLRRSVGTLAGVGAVVAGLSDVLVGSIEHAASDIGVSQFFVGAFVVAVVGNASEHYVAVVAATKNRMDLAVNIAIGSSAQIGLFVAPVLVLLSFVIGPAPMSLVFNAFEIAALLAVGLLAPVLVSDGESTWFEGVQLIALYAVIGTIFYAA